MGHKYAHFALMDVDRLQRLCVLLAGTIPHDDDVKAKILAALIFLRRRIETEEFRETLRAVDDVNMRMKKLSGD